MFATPKGQPGPAELQQAICRQVVERTGGQIRNLQVEVLDDCVVLRGCASCYYLKQLALQGVLDIVGSAIRSRIQLEVEVICCPTVPEADGE